MKRPAKTPRPDELRRWSAETFDIGSDWRRLGRDDEANAAFLSSCEMMDADGVIEARGGVND